MRIFYHNSLHKFLVAFIVIIVAVASSNAQPLKPTPNTVFGTEDLDYVFSEPDFPFTGGTGNLVGVVIRSLPAVGTLYLDTNSDGIADPTELILVGYECSAANLPKLKFKPLPDESGIPYTTFTFDINDGAVISAKYALLTIEIAQKNDSPESADKLVITDEDVNYVFAQTDFSFFDVDGDAFVSLKISSLETNGFLFLDANLNGINDAENITLNQIIAVADIPKLKFVSALNENGVSYSNFGFQVSDGIAFSSDNRIFIRVNPVNDAPSASNNTVSTAQEINYSFAAADFMFTDPDGDSFASLKISLVPAAGQLWIDADLSGTINGAETPLANNQTVNSADFTKLTFKPNAGENGSPYTTFNFEVSDALLLSPSYTMTINVTPVNQEPGFTKGPDQIVAEDSPMQTVNPWATAISPGPLSEAGQIITFHLSNDNNSLFSAQPQCNTSGVLTYTPAANKFGTANVQVYVTDDGGTADGGDDTSPTQFFTIEITAVNDIPVVNNQTFSVDENSANGTSVGTVIANDPDLDILTFSITGGNTNSAFAINSATGNITVNNQSELDFETTASYSLSVNVFDGTSNVSSTVTVNINNVNDLAPTLGASSYSTPENTANGTILGILNFSEPEGDALTFSITAGNTNSAFSVNSPSGELIVINSTGLDFETVPSFNLTVELSDGNFTVSNIITVNLTNNNDAPRFTSSPETFAVENILYSYNISTYDDDLNPMTITCPVKPAWLTSFVDNGNGTASLSGTPPLGSTGNYNVQLSVSDGITNAVQDYTIVVAGSATVVDWAGTGDYSTIQAAIDNASHGDLIIVKNGTYTERINFNGKNVILIGNTSDPSQVVIDGSGSGSVVTFNSGETASAKLSGFTITNGTGTSANHSGVSFNSPAGFYGGGIYCINSSPTLENLEIRGNSLALSGKNGSSGAGIYFGQGSNAILKNSIISDNTSVQYRGGGICVDNANITIQNSEIKNNLGGNYGGGISAWNSSLTIENTTVSLNSVTGMNGLGGGIFLLSTPVNITNTSVFGNSASVTANGVFSYDSVASGAFSGSDMIITIP